MAPSPLPPSFLFLVLLTCLCFMLPSPGSSSSRPFLMLSDDPFYSIINATTSSSSSPFSDQTTLVSGAGLRQANRTHDDDAFDAPSPPPSIPQSCFACQPTYGFLPCTDTVLGNLFLLAAYAYMIFFAGRLVSKGSEYLLTVLDAGLVGGLVLPILGALPDAILIVVSGLGGTQADAQQQILVGIGLLAGSIVMLLTLLWGSCLMLGRCDLEVVDGKLTAIDKQCSRPFHMIGTGVENDELTMLSARIMVMAVIPFIIAQLSRISHFTTNRDIPILVACVMAFTLLLSYCLYQVFTPWIQERRKEIAQKMLFKAGVLSHLLTRTGNATLINERGILDEEVAHKLFATIDKNNDGLLEKKELDLILAVTAVGGQENNMAKMVDQIMQEYDVDHDDMLTLDEFLNGLRKWCKELKLHRQSSMKANDQPQTYGGDLQRLEEEEKEEGGESTPMTKPQIIKKAVMLLIVGTIFAAAFADPLVDSVNGFSTASHIPSFFISFVLLPLASSASDGISSLLFAARKSKRIMSLTYSQIYGNVTMTCTMGLGTFLAVVYFRELVWDFSSEVLVVCVVTVIMGSMASFRKVLPTWMAVIALLLYPISLGLVGVLDYLAGWQ